MNVDKIIRERHSVRRYLDKNIEKNKVNELNKLINECNREGDLHIQLILNDSDTFLKYKLHYGKIYNGKNYIALVGKKCKNLEEKLGYYGEIIVLKAQELGLNTCWVAGGYKKGLVNADVKSGEKLICIIAIGYGVDNGKPRRSKAFSDVSKTKDAPDWYKLGIEYALLAPTAVNMQSFTFELKKNNKVLAKAGKGLWTKVDLGIVKYHFELGAGINNFEWY